MDGGALLRTLDVGGPVNIAPTVSDFAAGTDEDSPLPGQLTGTDPNGDPLTFHATGAVPVGLTVNPDGSWSFDPTGTYDYLDQGEQTTVTFQYQANDGSLDSNVGTATITITGLNDAPVIGVASVTGGSVTEAGDLPQIDEAGLGGGLEPVAALAAQIAGNATVSGALTDLLTNPGDVDAAVTTVKTVVPDCQVAIFAAPPRTYAPTWSSHLVPAGAWPSPPCCSKTLTDDRPSV